MNRKKLKITFFAAVIAAILLRTTSPATAADNIDPTDRYAYSPAAGWLNFNPSAAGVSVYPDHLEGYAWIEGLGWMRLGTHAGGGAHTYPNATKADYGVNHDGAGTLSGFAWSPAGGWINFSPANGGVTIDLATGAFDGYAWCEGAGWIHFKNAAPAYNVKLSLTAPSYVTSSATNRAYGIGETIPVEVVFNRPVTVSGTPQLTLETGAADARIDYIGGSGTASLTFNYTVEQDHASPDLDCLSDAALTPNGGAIKDSFNLDALLTLPAPGTTNSLGANKAIAIDGGAPGAPDVAGIAATKSATPTWTWTPAGGGIGVYRCAMDSGAWMPETALTAYTPLSPLSHGAHTLDVQERDSAGNWSPAGSWTIDVDLIPPDPPVVAGATPTNTDPPTWTWTSGGGGTGIFRCRIDNPELSTGALEPVASPYTPDAAQGHGRHILYVQEKDSVGNWSASGAFAIDVDTIAPAPPTLSGLTPTRNTSPTWSWASSEGNTLFRYRFNGGALSGPVSDASYTAGNLTDGAYTLSVQERDSAGNWSDFADHAIQVDTKSPVAVIANPPASPTNVASFEFTVAGEGVAAYRYKLDSAVYSPEQPVGESIRLLNLPDGDHALWLMGRDAAGNWQPEAEKTVINWQVDTTGPVISDLPNFGAPVKTAVWTWKVNEPAKFRHIVATDPAENPTTGFVSLTEYKVEKTGVDGIWYLRLQAEDDLGNRSPVVTAYAVLDNTPPVVDGIENDDAVRQSKTWLWWADEPCVYRSTLNLTPEMTTFPDIEYSDENTAGKANADGKWYLHVQAKDIAGNESEIKTVYAVFDNAAAIISGLNDDPAPKQSVTWTWKSDEAGVQYRYVVDQNAATVPADADWFQPTTSDNSHAVTIPGDGDYPDGTWYLHVQAKDAAGAVSLTKTVYAVLDNTPPVITGLDDPDPVALRIKYWEWGADEKGTVFRHAVDRNETWPTPTGDFSPVAEASKAAEGAIETWYLHVQARDRAGNESLKTASVKLDPNAPIVPYITGDTPTANPRPTWEWRSGGGNRLFQYKLDDGAYSDPTYDTAFTPSQDQYDGTYTLYVREQDGDTQDWSAAASHAIVVDTAPPAALAIDGAPDPLTNENALELRFSGDDAAAYKYNLDSAIVYSEERPMGEPLILKDLAEGPHLLYVIARDAAGNWQSESANPGIVWAVDTQKPAIAVAPSGAVAAPAKTVTWTWEGAGEDGVTFRHRIDDRPTWDNPSGDFTVTATATKTGGDGTFYLHVQGRDPAGNTSEVQTVSAVLDNTPPTVTVIVDGETPAKSVAWSWSADDADPEVSFRFVVDQNLYGRPLGDYTGQTAEVKSGASGLWYLHLQARDRAGNESDVQTVSALLDNSPPVIAGLTSDPFPVQSKQWEWFAEPGDAFRYVIDRQAIGMPGPDQPFSTANRAEQPDGDGVYYLHVQAKDPLDNVGSVITVYALLDNTPPDPPQVTGFTPTSDATPTWNWSPGSGNGIESYRYRLDDPDLPSGGETTSRRFFTPEVPLPAGDHTLYVQQQDSVGNWSASGQFTILVDTQAGDRPGVGGPPSPTGNPLCTFNWVSGGGAGIYRYALNGGAWSTPTSQTQAVLSVPEGTNVFSVQERDETDNWSEASEYPVTVDTAHPCSKASGPAAVDDTGMTFTIAYAHDDVYSGERCGNADSGSGLKRVDLFVKGPGDAGFAKAETDAGGEIDGRFTYTVSQNRQGAYAFYTEAEDLAGNREMKTMEETRTVYVSAFSGYAILAVGAIAGEEGLPSHTLTANNIYKHLIHRNFALVNDPVARWDDPMDHIKYLNPYPDPQMGQDVFAGSYKTALQNAVTEWAPEKMAALSGPLFIVLVDHGAPDAFYLTGTERLSSGELDGWLEILEGKLDAAGVHREIILILGTCYSGSFIDNLSGPGRIIVTSTAADEVSYRGPKDPSGVRDGEFFLTALFNNLGQGRDLADSFATATGATEIHTDSGRRAGTAPYFDPALQHPLLDDNGDGKGSNDLGMDGDAAGFIRLGYDTGAPVPLTVSAAGSVPADPLSPSESGALIWAQVDDQTRAEAVWVEIREPGLTLEKCSDQQTVELIQQPLTLNPGTGRYEANYDGFAEPGRYTLFFYVRDNMGLISTFRKKYLYKGKEGNLPPRLFGLNRPAEGEAPPTTLLLDWNDAADPEGDAVAYTVWVSAGDEHFGAPLVFEGLNRSLLRMTDADGLNDATTYYWKVLAVDDYGAMTSSDVRSFTTNNNNPVAAWFEGTLYNTATGEGVDGADLSFQNDAGTSVFSAGSDGYLIDELMPDSYDIAATADGYELATVDSVLVPAGEVSQHNIGLDPIQAATPVMTPAGGTYDALLAVALASDTAGAVVHYTLDGTDPDDGAPVYSDPIQLTATATVKARAYADGLPESEIATEQYAFTNVDALPLPTFSPAAGAYPTAQSVAVSCAVDGATIRYTTDGTQPTSASPTYSAPIPVSETTTLKARAFKPNWHESETATGHFTLTGTVAPPAFSPGPGPISAVEKVTLACPTPGAAIHFTTDGTDPTAHSPRYTEPISPTASVTQIRARAFLAGWSSSAEAAAEYAVADMVARPAFSPPPGTYETPQLVSIACATPEADIRYTLDGAEPDGNSRRYQYPIYLPRTTTINARGFLADYPPGITASGAYTISIRKGDLNGDGSVDLGDVVTGLKVLAGVEASVWMEGDVDGNGRIDYGDLMAILRDIAGR